MWQKCPVCNGTGRTTPSTYSSNTTDICSVCKGQKIISQLTGLPPNNKEKKFGKGKDDYPLELLYFL